MERIPETQFSRHELFMEIVCYSDECYVFHHLAIIRRLFRRFFRRLFRRFFRRLFRRFFRRFFHSVNQMSPLPIEKVFQPVRIDTFEISVLEDEPDLRSIELWEFLCTDTSAALSEFVTRICYSFSDDRILKSSRVVTQVAAVAFQPVATA